MKKSPFAPGDLVKPQALPGVSFAACEAGLKYAGRKDLMIALLDAGTTVAGVFTTSKCASAPVDWCRTHAMNGSARALVVNAGNANAFTGMRGRTAVEATARQMADIVGCEPPDILIASTGVIGEPLDPTAFESHLATLHDKASPQNWTDAAEAIMTTDTYPKLASVKTTILDKEVAITGIAKGSGMIAPDMATMLAFIFTDANITAPVLRSLLKASCDKSFNAITVDSDTSTSDTVLLFATGKSGAPAITDPNAPEIAEFSRALNQLMLDLAHQIVKDGEGASKFVTVTVEGAEDHSAAKIIARSIANSPLVKTAIAGEDANWGRVVMAVGKAGQQADRDKLSIWFGNTRVAVKGERDPEYSENVATDYMKNDEITVRVDVGIGSGAATIWTCDLTKDYISINADYRS